MIWTFANWASPFPPTPPVQHTASNAVAVQQQRWSGEYACLAHINNGFRCMLTISDDTSLKQYYDGPWLTKQAG